MAGTAEGQLSVFIKTLTAYGTLNKEKREVEAFRQIIGSVHVQVFVEAMICRGVNYLATSGDDTELLVNLTRVLVLGITVPRIAYIYYTYSAFLFCARQMVTLLLQ